MSIDREKLTNLKENFWIGEAEESDFKGASREEAEKRRGVSDSEIAAYRNSLHDLHPIINDLHESMDEGYPITAEQVQELKWVITTVINHFERLGIVL